MQKILSIIILLLLLLLSGCRQVEYVTVDRVHSDTLYQKLSVHDSIYVRDSVYLHEWVKGDTVFVEKTKWRNVEKELLRVDTVYKVRVDSVAVPYPVGKAKGAVSNWQRFRMSVGDGFLIALLFGVVFMVLRWRKVL